MYDKVDEIAENIIGSNGIGPENDNLINLMNKSNNKIVFELKENGLGR